MTAMMKGALIARVRRNLLALSLDDVGMGRIVMGDVMRATSMAGVW
jgi:hypothetical protein